mgnify:CR=1 FL=1
MMPTFVSHLDDFGTWRTETDARLATLAAFARDNDLLDEASAEWFEAMRARLSGEKLMVAFVAEFSRGKSELINAIFFSDKGRRMMPASAGRTTMCPVELGYDEALPVGLSLLPIETRLTPQPLADYRGDASAWNWIELDLDDAQGMADALNEVMRTRRVPQEEAVLLGFWDDQRPQDNPPLGADGLVEVPAWRHARINLPHPLLKRGLVVLDTPGLNAIGTEPELTLGLLPQAHATVFILGADTGVTKSDLDIWRDHLSGPALARFVVLNKIDTLADPLSTPEQVQDVIRRQCDSVAGTLEVPREHVFPVSARQALTSRPGGQAEGVDAVRIDANERDRTEVVPVHHGRRRVRFEVIAQFLGHRHDVTEQRLQPVSPEQLKLCVSGNCSAPEVGVHAHGHGALYKSLLGLLIRLQTLLGAWFMAWNVKAGGTYWGNYRRDVVAHTDYRKFDDTLRMVLDSTPEQRMRLAQMLEPRRQRRELVYGIHVAREALMTCLIFDRRNSHAHFVDGANGGYALAAQQLKAQLEEAGAQGG